MTTHIANLFFTSDKDGLEKDTHTDSDSFSKDSSSSSDDDDDEASRINESIKVVDCEVGETFFFQD